MILKICPYCQAENPENANFCKKCGALFRGNAEKRDTVAEKNKKLNKLIIAAGLVMIVAAIAVIMRGTGKKPEAAATTSSGTTVTTTASNTTLPALTIAPSANATTVPITTTVPTTTATTTTAPAMLSTEEICKQYNELVGAVKGNTSAVSVHKTEKINMEITHFSLPFPMDAINNFMAKLIPETDITYNFLNGTAKEDSKISLSAFLPPALKTAPDVTAEDLLSAEKDANGTITLKFKADTSSFADGQTVMPQYVDSATDVLDFATFALGPVKIVSADIQYPGAEIKAETDTEGKLTKLIITQPVTVMSTGGVGSLTADVGMNLKATTTYEIK